MVEAAAGPLALSSWERAEPRAAILALHGFGDYGPSTYEDAAVEWEARGIATHAYDQRGFGRNASRGRWPGAGALVADLRAVTAEMRRRYPCIPLVVVGHSMGGGVTAAAAGGGLEADGLVLAAPAIWGGARLNPFHRALAWTAAATVPDRRFTGEGIVRIVPTDNTAMIRRLQKDPLYLRPPSAREIMGLVRITDLAAEAAPVIRLPTLLLLGDKDQIVPEAAVRETFAEMPGGRRVIDYEEGWHMLFRDLNADRVWGDVAEFALSLPPPACPPPS